jgi:hypothetical protein
MVNAPKPRGLRAFVYSWALGPALVLLVFLFFLVFFVVRSFHSDANQVVGSPTRAQVTGTWEGDSDMTLVLRPNGTFTTQGLPSQVGTAAPVLSASGDVLDVWSGHGTWTIGPGAFGGSPESVIFTVDCGTAPGGCAGHPRSFDLQLETNSPQGGGGPALFYYLGSPHDLSNQYPFVVVPAGD